MTPNDNAVPFGPYILVTATAESLCPVTMKVELMPLYGPQEFFPCEPQTYLPGGDKHDA